MEKFILKKQEFEAVTLDLTMADANFTKAKQKLHDFISKNFGAKITKDAKGRAVATTFMKPILSCNKFIEELMKIKAEVHSAYLELHRLRAKNKDLYFQVKDYIAEDASQMLAPRDQGKPVDEKPQDQIPAIKEDGQLTVKLTRGELKGLVDTLIDNLTNSPKSWFIVDFSDKITVIPQETAEAKIEDLKEAE